MYPKFHSNESKYTNDDIYLKVSLEDATLRMISNIGWRGESCTVSAVQCTVYITVKGYSVHCTATAQLSHNNIESVSQLEGNT